jgi:hypothetical protein
LETPQLGQLVCLPGEAINCSSCAATEFSLGTVRGLWLKLRVLVLSRTEQFLAYRAAHTLAAQHEQDTGSNWSSGLRSHFGPYGIRRIVFNEKARTLRVEYDASRLSEAWSPGLLRSAELDLLKRVGLTKIDGEIEFLERLRFKGSRPTPLCYYRELQNLSDPLHFREA